MTVHAATQETAWSRSTTSPLGRSVWMARRAACGGGTQVIALRPRSLAMLRYLVEHPGRLVTKAELRQHVWAGTHVTDTVLRVCVQEIRAALGDAAAAPQYLETVGRQGYRFLVGDDQEVPPPLTAGPIVGRQREVDALEAWFQRAAHGARQLVLVSGEAGMGKTTVVDLWLARLAAGSGVRIARGQCVEHYGEGEPYLPLLGGVGAARPRARGTRTCWPCCGAMRRMWLVQLPGLLQRGRAGAPAAPGAGGDRRPGCCASWPRPSTC